MDLQRLYSSIRQAVDMYGLIEEGDKIAVGISGGKDSLVLLYGLAGLRKFYPKKFQVVAITIDLGLGMDFAGVEALCKTLEVQYEIVKTDINRIVFQERNEENPCSLCAKLRKGALNNRALELECNKIAYAHHRDDFIDTFYMSLFIEGRLNTLSPMYTLDKTGLVMIRPLVLTSERDIVGFKNKYELPVVENKCPADGNTKRQEMKEVISDLRQKFPDIRKKTFTAISNGNFQDWPEKLR